MIRFKLVKCGALLALTFVMFATSSAQVSPTSVPSQQVQALLDEANRLVADQKLPEALKKSEEALKLADDGHDSAGQAAALLAVGLVEFRLGHLTEAAARLEQAQSLSARSGDKKRETEAMRYLAAVTNKQGHADKALEIYNTVIKRQKADSDDPGLALTYLGVTDLYAGQDPEKTLEFGDLAMKTAVKVGDFQTVAAAMVATGQACSDLGLHEKAVERGTMAIKVAKSGDMTLTVIDALSLLGSEYEDAGQYPSAIDSYRQALQLAKTVKDRKLEGRQLLSLGIVSDRIGQERLAIDYFKQSVDAFQDAGESAMRAAAMQDLGVALDKDGQETEAVKWVSEALALHKQNGDRNGEAGCLGTLGSIATQAKQYPEACDYIQKAAAIFHETGDQEAEATAANALGRVFVDQARYPEAIQQFDAAIKTYDKLGAQSYAATSYGNKAYALLQQSKLPESEACYEEAVSRYENVRTSLGGLSDAKISYLNQRVNVYKEYVDVLTRLGKSDAAFDIAQKTKARGLLDLLASGRVFPSSELSNEERAKEKELNDRADYLNARMVKEGVENEVGAKKRFAALSQELQKVEDERSQFMTNLYAKHPGLSRRQVAETASIDQFMKIMPEDTTIVEFIVCDDEVVALDTLKHNGVLTINGHSMVLSRAELEKKCAELHLACASPNGDYQGLAQELYRDLIRPLEKDLAGKSRIVFCPDSCLWDVPFAVLMPNESTFLSDKFEVDYCYSATGVWAALSSQGQKKKGAKDILVCANPEFGSSARFGEISASDGQRPIDTPSRPIDQPSRAIDSVSRGMTESLARGAVIAPLPGTQREADAVKALFPDATILTGTAAQEATIKREAPAYRYIHLATHGFVNDAAPLLSSIILARPTTDTEDGFLTARELYGMDLHADLVVLSSCNSARGEVRSGEGIVGLSWAVFVAGCPSQVLSQWSVDDASTAELMTGFYKNLVTGHKPKGAALHEAARQIKDNPQYRHPYYWAPFILIGDWR